MGETRGEGFGMARCTKTWKTRLHLANQGRPLCPCASDNDSFSLSLVSPYFLRVFFFLWPPYTLLIAVQGGLVQPPSDELPPPGLLRRTRRQRVRIGQCLSSWGAECFNLSIAKDHLMSLKASMFSFSLRTKTCLRLVLMLFLIGVDLHSWNVPNLYFPCPQYTRKQRGNWFLEVRRKLLPAPCTEKMDCRARDSHNSRLVNPTFSSALFKIRLFFITFFELKCRNWNAVVLTRAIESKKWATFKAKVIWIRNCESLLLSRVRTRVHRSEHPS